MKAYGVEYYEMYLKIPRLGKKKCWLKLLILAAIFFQNSLLGNVYSYPIVLSTLQKYRGNHFP
jgi:hypothetical protein